MVRACQKINFAPHRSPAPLWGTVATINSSPSTAAHKGWGLRRIGMITALRTLNRYFALALLFLASSCGQDTVSTEAQNRSVSLLFKANEAMKQHEFLPALALVDSAAHYSPKSPSVHFQRARILSELGRFPEARSEYDAVVKLDPNYRGVWHNIANNEYRERHFENAIGYYRKALELENSPTVWRGLGRAYVEKTEFDSARVAFERAISLDSTYAPAFASMALLEQDEGHFQEALRHAEIALRLNPQELSYAYLTGSLLVSLGRDKEAVPHLERVLQEQPWHAGAHYNLGQALVRLKQPELAQKHLDLAEGHRKAEAKINLLQESALSSKDPLTFAAIGYAMRREGRYNDAMHAYKAGLYLEPNNIEIRNNIAILHLIRQDTVRAIQELEQILAIDPSQSDIWVNAGTLYALSGSPEKAEKAWLTALRYKVDHQQAKANLFKLYRERERSR